MTQIKLGDLSARYELSGAANGPVAAFSNSLGTNLRMWDPQAAALAGSFRVLRYDTRGHGETAVTPGPYSVDQLGRDVLRLLDALNLDRVHFCGLSLGGMIGMWLGVNAPERLHSLVLANTAARIGTVEGWNARIERIREVGLAAAAPSIVERWLTPEFRARAPELRQSLERMLVATPAEGYVACCAALRDADLREAIAAIRLPVLVIGGTKDLATQPADTHAVAERIPGARYIELDTAHLSNLEATTEFNAEILRCWTS
ncbi:MAG: 3-oxoadipate enol-lactonase [Acidobacteriota bacterium]|nr:3-oxoadipate enol-lactonase [Acidobacteriota bacterium]